MFGRICLSRRVGEGIIVSALNISAALWISNAKGERLALTIFDGRQVRLIHFRLGEEISIFENFTLQVSQTYYDLQWTMNASKAYRIVRAEALAEESAVA